MQYDDLTAIKEERNMYANLLQYDRKRLAEMEDPESHRAYIIKLEITHHEKGIAACDALLDKLRGAK